MGKKKESDHDPIARPKARILVDCRPGVMAIEAPGMYYGNIQKMYTNGHGHSLQDDEGFEPKHDEIMSACDKIADSVYALQAILEDL